MKHINLYRVFAVVFIVVIFNLIIRFMGVDLEASETILLLFSLYGVIGYLSVFKVEKWYVNLLLSSVMIIIGEFFFYQNPISIISLSLLYGGILKKDIMYAKLNPKSKFNLQQDLEEAIKYRMHFGFRIAALIMGTMFTFVLPYMVYSDWDRMTACESPEWWWIVLLGLFLSIASGVGGIFLYYGIIGSHPKFVLRQMENQHKQYD